MPQNSARCKIMATGRKAAGRKAAGRNEDEFGRFSIAYRHTGHT
jgi:hypothetical protein